MNWQKLQTVEVWLKGLIAAGISAGASVPGVMSVDPAKFNLHGGLGSVFEAVSITASGTALVAETGTATLTGSTTSMACVASAAGTADPDTFPPGCYISTNGTATVTVVTRVTDASPGAIVYNVRLIP